MNEELNQKLKELEKENKELIIKIYNLYNELQLNYNINIEKHLENRVDLKYIIDRLKDILEESD